MHATASARPLRSCQTGIDHIEYPKHYSFPYICGPEDRIWILPWELLPDILVQSLSPPLQREKRNYKPSDAQRKLILDPANPKYTPRHRVDGTEEVFNRAT